MGKLLRIVTTSLVFTATFLIIFTEEALVRFYDEARYTGLFFESSSTAPCTNISGFGWDKASSVDVDGSCIMLYANPSCDRLGRSIKLDGDTIDNDDLNRKNFNNMAKSFHFCTADEGGTKIHVDLYDAVNLDGSTLLVNYRDICGCVNLPTYSFEKVSSVNNHGNCIVLYSEMNCQGGRIDLIGGNTAESLNLSVYPFDNIAKSIGMCEERPYCLRFDATVFKYELKENPGKALLEASEDAVEISAKTTLYNNGSAAVTQEYIASKMVKESMEIERISSMMSMNSVSTSRTVISESQVSIPFFAKWKTTTIMTEAYTYTNMEGSSQGERYKREEQRVFTASQKFEIPPCTKYDVTSFVITTEGFPIDYTLFAYIKGVNGKMPMTWDELEAKVVGMGMTFVEKYDDYTIVANATSTIRGTYGVVTSIDGVGEPIDGCHQRTDMGGEILPVVAQRSPSPWKAAHLSLY